MDISTIDFKLLQFIADNDGLTEKEIKNKLHRIEALSLRLQDLQNSRYITLKNNSDYLHSKPATYSVTNLGKSVIQDELVKNNPDLLNRLFE